MSQIPVAFRILKHQTNPAIFLRVIACFVLLMPSYPKLTAQNALAQPRVLNPETAHVSWVNQYPSTGNNHAERGFGTKFADFVFGKKNRAELTRPVAVSAVNPGLYWTIDQENGLIFKIDKQLGEITQFRNKQYRFFPSLVGICTIPTGKFLFTDSFLNKIFIATPDKKGLKSLNDSLSFDRPTGIAFSPSTHEIWIVETNAHRITIVDETGKFRRRIGSRGIEPGQFNYPTSIWIDSSGKVYIVDALNFRVQIFSVGGDLLGVFGKNGDAPGNFARQKGIATDSYGNIYVADALFNVVQIFNTSGQFLYAFGKQGQSKGEFWMPSGLFIDQKDFIYVADSYNARVQVFQLIANGGQE